MIIIILILLLVAILTYSRNTEKFSDLTVNNSSWNPRWVGQRASDCHSLDKEQCLNYTNCGLCLNNNHEPKCVHGDVHGPLFTERCQGWAHTDFYDRHIFGEKVTRITPPWSHVYSDYETWYPSPQVRATL